MQADDPREITRLLKAWTGGDSEAFNALLPIVYDELRRLAAHYLRSERGQHTLQPTALVHEAYLRLVGADVALEDRTHFFVIAARTMRRVLVDHARERGAAKRGGGWIRTTLQSGIAISDAPPLELIDLDRAIDALLGLDERAARAAELHYFAGLGYEDVAKVLDVSAATVHRDLRFARAWLLQTLTEGSHRASSVEPS